ncbi:uncharacterized protein C8A04DRAFT_29885 [Dichotomopilus funicola]|uniref:Uncharacterized protein n=1 Tax=Dichotomopilus funicola TaxID=1934379 RepID=A0AAN6V081_9PEZI|nr:hypothetical protein C8A04DRAFT_29885 [Dichotomopilus funicola]
MQLTVLTVLAGAVASVSAAGLTPKATVSTFHLVARDLTNSPIDKKVIRAKDSQLWVGLHVGEQGADCDKNTPSSERATFFLKDDELFLYGGEEDSHQQFGLDISLEDDENLEYFNNTLGNPNELVETHGWSIDPGSTLLSYRNHPFVACQKSDGLFTVGIFTYNVDPDTICYRFNALTVPASPGCSAS